MKTALQVFVFTCATLLSSAQASTHTYNVNTTVDSVDANPGDGICADSLGRCSLRAAVMESNYTGGTNTINLPAGTYTLTLSGISGGPDDEFDALGDDQTGGDLDILDLNSICTFLGGCPGTLLGGSALASVTIAGAGMNTTIIQMGTLGTAGGANKDRILDINPFSDPQFPINVTVKDLTMQNGSAPNYNVSSTNFFHEAGGAIQFDGTKSQSPNAGPTATLTLVNVKFNSNTGAGQGGAVFINWGSGAITNCIFTSNTSTFGSGGAISYNGGNINLTQTLTISGTTIGGVGTGNQATNATAGNGGGVNTTGGTGITMVSNTISGNIAGNQGGAISFANSPVIVMSNSSITNNTAKNNGGAIYLSARNAVANTASTAVLSGVTITGNIADSDNNNTGNGGGIYCLFGTLTVQTSSQINGNTAVNGGGIYSTWTGNVNDSSPTINVTGGQISTNNAKNNGGAFGFEPGAATTKGTFSIQGALVTGNRADSDSNASGNGGAIFLSGGTLSGGFNRIVNNNAVSGKAVAQTGGTATVTNNWWGTNNPAGLMSGTVGFAPMLQLLLTANPNPIFVPNSTTVTASFLTNSAGTFIPVSNLPLLVGLPLTFNNPIRGTISSPQTAIQPSGTATVTFTANTAGTGSVDATVDNQTTTGLITIPTGVKSISRLQVSPTNLPSVQWSVTFTNGVTNVTAGNFLLVNSGLGGAPAITGVTPVDALPATNWTVTASTGSGSGTLGLNMVNYTGVSAIITNLPFTGQVYTIDLVAPDTTITAQPAALTNNAAASFSFTASDVGVGVANIQCQLDGAGYTNCTSPVNFSGLSSASHTFNVRAIDGVGNTDASPATVTWTVDTIPPTVNCSTDIVVTANGYCPPAVNFAVSVSDNVAIAIATTNPPSGSVFQLGTNTVTLGARDTAGNTNFCTFKVIVLPGAAPQLTMGRNTTNVVISWTNVYPCYALQYSTNLIGSNWLAHPGPFATNNGNIYLTNTAPFTSRFFRLFY